MISEWIIELNFRSEHFEVIPEGNLNPTELLGDSAIALSHPGSTENTREHMVFLSCPPGLWFSNVYLHENHLECLLRQRWLGPTPRVSDSVGLDWGPRICTVDKFTDNADNAGSKSHFEKHGFRTKNK